MTEFFSDGWILPTPSCTLLARFESQPPEDLRKSNFFNFRIELRTHSGPVDIVGARFEHYLNEEQNGIPHLKNGIKYSVTVKYPNEVAEERDLYLMLVDAATHEPIPYEGHDYNPKMQRVLLTHETICTRCSLNKSCGNKNEAPSDPGITARGLLKFFLKCNQNCLKGAGNPRDMRRFALAVSFQDMTYDKSKIVAVSNQMFVHNNSKHSRKRKSENLNGPDPGRIRVLHLVPSGDRVTVVGESFPPDIRVFIDDIFAAVTHLSEHVLEAWIPPNCHAPTCRLTLQHGEHFLEAGSFRNERICCPRRLATISPAFGTIGEEFDFISTEWAIPGVSFMCGDVHLPIEAMVRNTVLKVQLPYDLPRGLKTITVIWNNRVQFAFPFLIRDRRQELVRSTEQSGFICLLRKGCREEYRQMNADRNSILVCAQEFDGRPFDQANEWSIYFDTIRCHEHSSSYSSSGSERIRNLSGSDPSSL